ncbi:hypothetical protein DLE54_08235 [Psychrobacter sp. YP14]|jgi:hypothetical protein|uniref:Uncharacterized protein n=3 Tax=Psychrobacter TaxID=497 RepID=A0A844M116_9GAMM|nr:MULTISPECIES: hypothetical protein [Psychrobacter]AWT49496.1 hypothetical protein DLE54_08235 [Psychrobacter sp. YP14]MUG32298.1 hypothetical protein [Psychrobacter sanguinis]
MMFITKKVLPLFALGASAAMFITPAQALDIKQDQIDQCVKGTVSYKVADNATAKKLCSCTVNVRSKMTLGQMWEIESYAQSGKDPSKLSYAKNMQNELQQCTKGLKLNPPQKPKA